MDNVTVPRAVYRRDHKRYLLLAGVWI